jgi:Ser/Thr protein kinase RdoA (MazF antagonist)
MPPGAANHEAAMTWAVEALGLPVARCYGRVDLNGRAGILFERIVGTSLLEVLLNDPAQMKDVAQMLARLHAHLHAVNAPALPWLNHRLADRIRQAKTLSPLWREAAIRRLRDLPDGDVLCHGDFHPGNVLLAAAGPVVIDWIDVSRGYPLVDVARTVALIRYGEAP